MIGHTVPCLKSVTYNATAAAVANQLDGTGRHTRLHGKKPVRQNWLAFWAGSFDY